jgi:hypothetical protein
MSNRRATMRKSPMSNPEQPFLSNRATLLISLAFLPEQPSSNHEQPFAKPEMSNRERVPL